MPGWSEKLKSEVSSLSSENTRVFILNKQVFKVRRSLSCRRSFVADRPSLILPITKNLPSAPAIQVGNLNTINKPIFKSKMPQGMPGENVKASN